MLQALTDPNKFMQDQDLEPDELITIGDVNHDRRFDNRDIQPLLDLVAAGQGAASTVPEPATLLLAAVAFPGFAFWQRRRIGACHFARSTL
jgi:hypothetical protein